MTGFIFVLHALVCILLAMIILMQSGRGGGLTEQFASAESVFGAKTNIFMVKATGVLASVFIVICLVLAYFSSKSDRSIMSDLPMKTGAPVLNMTIPIPMDSSTSPTNTKDAKEDVKAELPVSPQTVNAVGVPGQ